MSFLSTFIEQWQIHNFPDGQGANPEVMFLHLPVILFTGGGGCLPHCMLGYTPLGRSPHGQTPLGLNARRQNTPPRQTPPWADPHPLDTTG